MPTFFCFCLQLKYSTLSAFYRFSLHSNYRPFSNTHSSAIIKKLLSCRTFEQFIESVELIAKMQNCKQERWIACRTVEIKRECRTVNRYAKLQTETLYCLRKRCIAC